MALVKYLVSLPTVGDNPADFTFRSNFSFGVIAFDFRFFNSQWYVFATLPSGEIRYAGVNPNVLNWSCFTDFKLQFVTTLDFVGWNDLNNIQMVLWTY